jgi:hypothetical protein
MGLTSAGALPVASGSKCSSNWVNNAAAMSCFIQGEEEANNGAKHPHYVACSAAGEVFCCVDDDRGNQNCEIAAAGGQKTSQSAWIRAILAAQRTHLEALGRFRDRPGETRLPGQNRKPQP